MAVYALVKNKIVVNVVVADQDWIDAHAGDYDEVIAYADDDPYPGPGTNLDPAAVPLEEQKGRRYEQIDKRTRELIAEGFTYKGQVFSLSSYAQSYWNGLGNLAANGLLQAGDFPLYVNGLDDADPSYGIADVTEAVTIFATAAAAVKAALGSGTTLKDKIRAAADQDELDAVVDPR